MMNRRFTTREKVLLLVFAVLFLGIFYYMVVYRGTAEAMARYDTTTMEDELVVAQTRYTNMEQMKETIKENQGKKVGTIEPYNNLQGEITELNSILSDATTYNLDFADATTDGSIVRRDISVTYHTTSYQAAKHIMQELYECKYKCLIRDVSMSTTSSSADAAAGLQNAGDIDVSLGITFYESVTDETQTVGLAEYQPESATTE